MAPSVLSLIRRKKIKFFFRIESVADLNSVHGFIRVLGIPRGRVVIWRSPALARGFVKKTLNVCAFTTRRPPRKNWFQVTFDTEGPTRLAWDGHLVVNYDPFKYVVRAHVSKKSRRRLRARMKILGDRKVIFVSCTGRDEAEAVIEACKGLNLPRRPLIILGFRKPDASVARCLVRRGFRVNDRRSARQSLSYFGGVDVVVLNTMGELFTLMRAADLAIIGHDRNIFEPAFLDVPILYFGNPLSLNKSERKLALLFRLFWRKNRTAKKLLDRFKGAAQIRKPDLSRQIERVLHNPEPMIRGTLRAVRAFRREVIPARRLSTARVLAAGLTHFNETSKTEACRRL